MHNRAASPWRRAGQRTALLAMLCQVLLASLAPLAAPAAAGAAVPVCTGYGVVYLALDGKGAPAKHDTQSHACPCCLSGCSPLLVLPEAALPARVAAPSRPAWQAVRSGDGRHVPAPAHRPRAPPAV